MEEGISSEASSLAGTQQLGNLTLLYDDNHISIEDNTIIAFNEEIVQRYDAYGWHTQRVNWLLDDGRYEENVAALDAAYRAAEAVTDKPSFIALRTIIAWPAPHAQNTGKAHGSALGADEVAATKKILGFDPEQTFEVAPEVIEHTRKLGERGSAAGDAWDAAYAVWSEAHPERAELLHRINSGALPDGWDADLPTFDADPKGVATRKASGAVINAIAAAVPELWGGSADLAESNNTTIEEAGSFLPVDRAS